MGCKTAVGMPFKEVETTNSIFFRVALNVDDAEDGNTLRRLA